MGQECPGGHHSSPHTAVVSHRVGMEAQRASLAQGHTAAESEPGLAQSPNSLTPLFHTNADAWFHSPFSKLGAPGSRDQREESAPKQREGRVH